MFETIHFLSSVRRKRLHSSPLSRQGHKAKRELPVEGAAHLQGGAPGSGERVPVSSVFLLFSLPFPSPVPRSPPLSPRLQHPPRLRSLLLPGVPGLSDPVSPARLPVSGCYRVTSPAPPSFSPPPFSQRLPGLGREARSSLRQRGVSPLSRRHVWEASTHVCCHSRTRALETWVDAVYTLQFVWLGDFRGLSGTEILGPRSPLPSSPSPSPGWPVGEFQAKSP